MLIVKDKPTGVDWYIQQLQTALHKGLMKAWNLDPNDPTKNKLFECYGRCYRNKKDNGYIAEVFDGGNEYKEVYWSDSLYAISFFGLQTPITIQVQSIAQVHLIFFVNLAKLKPALTTRADQEVRADVEKIIGAGLFSFKPLSVDLWIENVLKEYQGSRRDDRLKVVDMHPIHCFRINMQLFFDPNKIC